MRPRFWFALASALLILAPVLAQEPAPSPRQSLERAEVLFAQGHVFTAEERRALADVRQSLADQDDADLAADLDLLLRASSVAEALAQARTEAQASLPADADAWTSRETVARDKLFWRGVRDGGLISFTLSTATTLLLATINERNDSALSAGYFSDWKSRMGYNEAMHWVLAASAGTMFLSLFPLLWGEARQ